MPSFDVSRSIVIHAPMDAVYQKIHDLREWPSWSPWLRLDPEAKVVAEPDGSAYSWEGKVVGSGEMRVLDAAPSRSVNYALTFHKPCRSHASVRFQLEDSDEGVRVVWSLSSKLPWFMAPWRRMMVAFIGMDYERGLSLLKDLLEKGSIPSELQFPGTVELDPQPFVGIRTDCSIDEVGPAMERDLKRLTDWLSESPERAPSGPPFSQYHDWNVVKGTTRYTLGFPLKTAPSTLPDGMVSGQRPGGPAFVIQHRGPYRHLGNAWSAGFMRVRSRLIRQNKRIPPFEIYHSDPGKVPEEDVETILYFPLK